MTLGRSALGKGLSALIPAPRFANQRDDFFLCPVDDVTADPGQPRQRFDDDRLDELVASIKEKGILQPIVVRKNPEGRPLYIVIAGERRLRASRKAGLTEIPVLVKEVASNEALELALIENLQREDLNPIEEAQAYQRLLESEDYTQDVLARRLGKNRSTIANALRLLRLETRHQTLVVEGRLSAGHARCLLAVEDEAHRAQLAEKILAEDLSVREAEEWVRKDRETPREVTAAEPATPRVTPLQPYYEAVAADLAAALGAETQIQSRGRKGRIVISFESLDELRRLKALLAPGSELARTA
ncbi:MAG: ParB/RepB/Spo0J family partition protein [Deltaproteobacteria bacterium]|jgi:ParB family chromosome partitioning protein|nr:ParB/RepB/Spo0J family partition protein [Deltaproteobacteria bacterium]